MSLDLYFTLNYRASQVAQMVKNSSAMQKTWVWSLGWDDLLEKEMATHFSILAWRVPWTKEPGGLQSMGVQRIGHDWVTNSTQSAKTRPGADCGSDHELFIAKFRVKLKKRGETTRPFRYDLNQISYDYTVEVRNRFKGLDLIDRVPEELWMEVHDIVTGDRDQDHSQEKEMQKTKMVVWGGLTNSCEKKRNEKQRRTGKICPFECRVPKKSKKR